MYTDSTIVLTGVGGAGQVGAAVAAAFGKLGASLALVDRNARNVAARASELTQAGHSARAYSCDLTSPDEVAALAQRIGSDHHDRVRALVHLAGGFAMSGTVADSSFDDWNRLIAINLTTAFLTTRAFLPLLRRTRGSIVLFSAQPALPGGSGPNMSAYAVAKSGVAALMRAIAEEERQNGVRANAVAPVAIRTATNEAEMGRDAHFIDREQVADVVTFLCSDAASAITGELLPLS
jgi:Short-chain dehydrogenases of various substrate specificities